MRRGSQQLRHRLLETPSYSVLVDLREESGDLVVLRGSGERSGASSSHDEVALSREDSDAPLEASFVVANLERGQSMRPPSR